MALSGTLFAIVVGLTILWSLLDKWKSHVQKRPPSKSLDLEIGLISNLIPF